MEGREPEQFFADVFDWIETNTRANKSDKWIWQITDKGIVDMRWFYTGLPAKFIDKSEDLQDIGEITSSGEGINDLISKLQGKKVISINSNERWFLRTIS